MPQQIRVTTQMDLFPSEGALPEWLCTEWQCLNRCTDITWEECSLPSIQYSLPPYLKLSGYALSYSLLEEEEQIRESFLYIQMLYSRIIADGTEALMIELDQCLSYVSMAAQNMCIAGNVMPARHIAHQFKNLLLRVGSLRDFACGCDSLSTGNIEANYHFHAILLVWTSALRVFYVLKESPIGLDLLYPPVDDDKSIVSQVAALLAYGFLVLARITRLPFACKCVKVAWQQLYYTLGNDFFIVFEMLLKVCLGSLNCPAPENPTTLMLFDVFEARGSVDAEIFLNVFCALQFRRKHFPASDKSSNGCLRCMEKIALQISDLGLIVGKLCAFFDGYRGQEQQGVESILQNLFNRLAQRLNDSSSVGMAYLPENGKQWMDYVKSQCHQKISEADGVNEWGAFMRLIFIVIPHSSSAWRSLKPRVFSRFTSKRLREMPIGSFVQLVSFFLSLAFVAEFEEAAEKMLHLFSAMFGDCDKDRMRVILRAVHALIELCREKQQSESRLISALVSFMEKLSEVDQASDYAESYLYVFDKAVMLNNLPKFMASMNDLDVCRILEASASVKNINDAVWEAGLRRLHTSSSSQALTFLARQLRLLCDDNRSLASLRMRSIRKSLMDEKNVSVIVAFDFLRKFFQGMQQDFFFPLENIFPLWLMVLLLMPDSESLVLVSGFVFNGFREFLRTKGTLVNDFDCDRSTSAAVARRILEKLSVLPVASGVSARHCLESWLELVLPPLYVLLPKANIEIAESSTRVVSYIFELDARLIFKPPGECIFNRSIFVRLCKLYLQNTLPSRSFQESFLEECVPSFLTGLLSLPVSSTPYLQRILSDLISKFSSLYSLKELLRRKLGSYPDVIAALRRGSSVDPSVQKFLSSFS